MTEYVTVWEDGQPTELRWAAPVVRCRDCIYKRRSWNGRLPAFVQDGLFCAYWGGHEL